MRAAAWCFQCGLLHGCVECGKRAQRANGACLVGALGGGAYAACSMRGRSGVACNQFVALNWRKVTLRTPLRARLALSFEAKRPSDSREEEERHGQGMFFADGALR